MNKKQILCGMIDGAIQALALFVLNSLYVSIYVESSQIAYFPAISAVAAAILTLPFVIMAWKTAGVKPFVFIIFGSLLGFAAFYIALVIIKTLIPFLLFPVREVANAEGFIILLICGFFCITAVILRICLVIFVAIKNGLRSTGDGPKTGDGSLS